MLNWEQVKGVVERVATMAFMYAAGKGWLPPDLVGGLVTIVVAIGPVIWALWVNSPAQLVSAVVNVVPPDAAVPTQKALVGAAASMEITKKVTLNKSRRNTKIAKDISHPEAVVTTT